MKIYGHVLLAATFMLAAPMAQAATWTKYTYPDDGVSISFTGPVTTETAPSDMLDEYGLARLVTYSDDTDSHSYALNVTVSTGDDNDFEGAVAATIASMQCASIEKTFAPPIDNGKSSAFEGTDCKGTNAGGRFYQLGRTLYQTLYKIDPAASRDEADHFLNSFRFLKAE